MVSKKQIIILLSSTFVAITGALLIRRRYQHQKAKAIEDGRQKKLKKYAQEQDFINEVLILLHNRQQNLLPKIEAFISKNYEETQLPSFKLLLLKLNVIFQKLRLSPEHEQTVTKTLKQMKEYVQHRKTKATLTEEVVDPYEQSLAEQEFAVQYYETVNAELTKMNPELLKRLRKEVSRAYKESPHLLFAKEKMVQFSAGSETQNLLEELVEEYKKDIKQHRAALAQSYSNLARLASSTTRKLELLNLALDLVPDADALLSRFMLYKTDLQKLPRTPETEELIQSYEAYAHDLEQAWLHHGKPKKVLLQVAKLGDDLEIFAKYHDQFFKYNIDIHDDVLGGLYKYYVYKQGKIDEFIALLDNRKAHYAELASSNPDNEKYMLKSWEFSDNYALYKSDAVLHKLEFGQCLELLESKSNSLNKQEDIEGSEVVAEIVKSLQAAFVRYPILSELFYKTRDEVLRNNKILPFDTYFQGLSKIEIRSRKPEDVMNIVIAINFILMAWTILPDVTFVTHAVAPAFFDNYIRSAIKKEQFSRGEHIFMLVAFPNYVVPILGSRPLDLIYSALRQKLEREEQQQMQSTPTQM